MNVEIVIWTTVQRILPVLTQKAVFIVFVTQGILVKAMYIAQVSFLWSFIIGYHYNFLVKLVNLEKCPSFLESFLFFFIFTKYLFSLLCRSSRWQAQLAIKYITSNFIYLKFYNIPLVVLSGQKMINHLSYNVSATSIIIMLVNLS